MAHSLSSLAICFVAANNNLMGVAEALDSQVIVAFWGLVTLLLVVIIVRRGRRTSPARLRLGSGYSSDQRSSVAPRFQEQRNKTPNLRQRDHRGSVNFAKQLNLLFEWQGGKYDAYEVLKLPAGSSMDQVTKAYDQRLDESQDESEKELILQAYRALVQEADS